jgi:hypothetical protein
MCAYRSVTTVVECPRIVARRFLTCLGAHNPEHPAPSRHVMAVTVIVKCIVAAQTAPGGNSTTDIRHAGTLASSVLALTDDRGDACDAYRATRTEP